MSVLEIILNIITNTNIPAGENTEEKVSVNISCSITHLKIMMDL